MFVLVNDGFVEILKIGKYLINTFLSNLSTSSEWTNVTNPYL